MYDQSGKMKEGPISTRVGIILTTTLIQSRHIINNNCFTIIYIIYILYIYNIYIYIIIYYNIKTYIIYICSAFYA